MFFFFFWPRIFKHSLKRAQCPVALLPVMLKWSRSRCRQPPVYDEWLIIFHEGLQNGSFLILPFPPNHFLKLYCVIIDIQ